MNKELKIKRFFVLLLVTCYLLLVTAPKAVAQTMSNQNYIIQTEGINAVSNTTLDANNLKPETENLSLKNNEGVNFKTKSGFDNTPSSPFSLSLSSDIVDFGILSPTNPIIRNLDLSIDSISTQGYSVIAYEDHPLKISSQSKEFIPDTTCDNGQCSEENADLWINTLTFGFGYRCDNITRTDCDSSFSKSNFYKDFADSSNEEASHSIMTGIGAKNNNVRLSYKVNIPGTQAQGIYSNIINYIAVPNF